MAALQQQGGDYFTSYCDLGVHELMLQDRPRTTFYRKFFETHRDFVKGKVVMDVGAGTGILSLFAATAGAKTVYAVEASQVASLCEEIVQDNGFESVIKVIHGAVEDITLPDGVRVDIIVSEWMGFYLLHESMLDSVLIARDRFLAPGGILVPSRACLYIAPVDMTDHFQERAEYWNNIYGYDFSPVASTINLQEVSKPLIKVLPPSTVKSEAVKLLDLDLGRMSVDEVKSFSEPCKFLMSDESRIHGFATWFDVSFEGIPGSMTQTSAASFSRSCGSDSSSNHTDTDKEKTGNSVDFTGDAKFKNVGNAGDNICDSNSKSDNLKVCDGNGNSDQQGCCKKFKSNLSKQSADRDRVLLSTSPFSAATHWKQTVIFLPQTIMVIKDVLLCCKVKMSQDSSNKRHYNISIELKDECGLDNDDDDEEEEVEEEEEGKGGENSDNDNDNDDDDEGNDSDDSCDHPVPCDCGSSRCRLISALMDKYDTEHQELVDEAEMVEMEAEMEAAKEIGTAIETEGWNLDMSGADGGETTNNNNK